MRKECQEIGFFPQRFLKCLLVRDVQIIVTRAMMLGEAMFVRLARNFTARWQICWEIGTGLGPARPGRRSLQAQVSKKVLRPSGPKSLKKKSRGESEQSQKSPKTDFSTLELSSRLFFQTFGARGSEDFSQIFSRLVETFGIGPGNLSSQGRAFSTTG